MRPPSPGGTWSTTRSRLRVTRVLRRTVPPGRSMNARVTLPGWGGGSSNVASCPPRSPTGVDGGAFPPCPQGRSEAVLCVNPSGHRVFAPESTGSYVTELGGARRFQLVGDVLSAHPFSVLC